MKRLDYVTWIVRRFSAFMMAIFMLLSPTARLQKQVNFEADHSADKTNYPYVYFHGFLGWGEDAKNNAYKGMPYLGMFNGDCLSAYRRAGYNVLLPTVDAAGSNWDRVCEAYAKLTGTRVDYGKAHSEAYGHERYGADYTGKAMLDQWDSEHKINLIGHSLGGRDIIVLVSLLTKGDEAERKATADGSLSGLFTGGKGDWIHGCVGLSSVYNGTTLVAERQSLIDTNQYLHDQIDQIKMLPWVMRISAFGVMNAFTDAFAEAAGGEVALPDTAVYDMNPDHTIEMNKDVVTSDDVYYFSLVHEDMAYSKLDGHAVCDIENVDPVIGALTPIMARVNTVTKGGLVLDESWQMNDGCVNTISQRAPFGAPTNDLSDGPSAKIAGEAKAGTYNIFPIVHATHMWAIGDFVRPQLDGPTYVMHIMEMINAI